MPDAREIYKEGFQHFANDRLDDAILKYREALELDPKYTLAWSALAMALSRRGDVDEAIEAGQRAVELEPDEPLGYTNLSIFYQQKGMIPEAEDYKAKAMQASMSKGSGS